MSRIVHVFKCPVCGYEGRLNDEDMKNLKKVFCGNFNCSNTYCEEVRVEIVDGEGNVGTVIV